MFSFAAKLGSVYKFYKQIKRESGEVI